MKRRSRLEQALIAVPASDQIPRTQGFLTTELRIPDITTSGGLVANVSLRVHLLLLGGQRVQRRPDMTSLSTPFTSAIRGEAQELATRARALHPADPKAEALLKVIDEKLAMPKNKVLVFCTFRHTLR